MVRRPTNCAPWLLSLNINPQKIALQAEGIFLDNSLAMRIHEYQAKSLLREYGIGTDRGHLIGSPDEIDATIEKFPDGRRLVLKAQIHAGGRGKGHFVDRQIGGGVQIVEGHGAAKERAREMLGNRLITKQTSKNGRCVNAIYVTTAEDVLAEYYLAILVDRSLKRPIILAGQNGGMDVESSTSDMVQEIVSPSFGLQDFQIRRTAPALGLDGPSDFPQFHDFLRSLYRLFWQKDLSLLEINPLAKTVDGRILALDVKMEFDDNGLFRRPEILELRDPREEDRREVEAAKFGLNYVALDGDVGCLVNGAGLAMATLDVLQLHGIRPANFLDVAGNSSEEQIHAALRILLSDQKLRGILINIFGGITCGDQVGRGIVRALAETHGSVPIVVRLEGMRAAEGKQILRESGLPIVIVDSLKTCSETLLQLTARSGMSEARISA